MRSTETTTSDPINILEHAVSQVFFKWNALKGSTLALSQATPA
jgi:hypothetical protein